MKRNYHYLTKTNINLILYYHKLTTKEFHLLIDKEPQILPKKKIIIYQYNRTKSPITFHKIKIILTMYQIKIKFNKKIKIQ